MPARHNLQWISKTSRGEDRKPKEEAKSKKCLEIHPYLAKLLCITLLEGNIYQTSVTNCKICHLCYFNLSAEFKLNCAIVTSHNLIHENSVQNQMRCTICGKLLVRIKSAVLCQDCMKTYSAADEARLAAGWGISVNTSEPDTKRKRVKAYLGNRRGI